MSDISQLTRYLPPVLWQSSLDPDHFLGRMLRIFEKMLTGIEVNARAVRAEAVFSNAAGSSITLSNPDDHALFRAGDFVTVVGTTERSAINIVTPAGIGLSTPLTGTYPGGTVRIADLAAGQAQLRVDNPERLAAGMRIVISQGDTTETNDVKHIDSDLVTLQFGVSHDYPMSNNALPVRIEDAAVISFNGVEQTDFRSFLATRSGLFNPWTTRSDLLPYLAQWLALSLREDWSPYQKRKLVATITGVYRERTLKSGLHRFLDIYAITRAHPRIALDDGEAMLRGLTREDGLLDLVPVCFSRFVDSGAGTASFMLHPTAALVDSQGRTFVADGGDDSEPDRKAAVWRLDENGESPMSNVAGIVLPDPVAVDSPPTAPLEYPVALTADSTDRISVLDRGVVIPPATPNSALYRFGPPGYTRTTVIDQSTTPSLPAVNPVDMALDDSGAFVILDRGFHALGDPPAGPSATKIVVVTETPLAVAVHPLAVIEEPTALAVDTDGRYIVADARDQFSDLPVRLWQVDPSAGWAATDLLAPLTAAENPLVFPTGIVVIAPGVFLLSDTGLTWGYDPLDPEGADPSYRYRAQDAAVYRVDLNGAAPRITRQTVERRLVSPTGITLDNSGVPLITDQGERVLSTPQRNWRARTHEFGAVVHFSRQRPIDWAARLNVRRNIADILNTEKPSASKWWMDI